MSCKLEHLVFCNVIIVKNSDHLNVIKISDTNESVKGDDIGEQFYGEQFHKNVDGRGNSASDLLTGCTLKNTVN